MSTINNTDDHPISVEQGKTYIETFTCQVLTNPLLEWDILTNPWIPLNLTTYNIRMMVRKTFDSAIAELYCTDNVITGAVQRFTKVNNTGTITLTLLPTDTSTLIFKGDAVNWYYDIELISNTGQVILLAKGNFNLAREITR